MAAEGCKALTQLCRQRTRMSGSDGAPIDADHGHDFCPCPGHEAFVSRIQVVAGEEAFGSAEAEVACHLQNAVPRHPLEGTSRGCRGEELSLPYEEDVISGALGHIAFGIEHHRFEPTGLLRFEFSQNVVEIVQGL